MPPTPPRLYFLTHWPRLSHSPHQYRFLSPQCPHHPPPLLLRPLTTTPPLQRNASLGKLDSYRTVELNATETNEDDNPRDFSAFKTEIEKATAYLRSELAKLKTGGLDLEAIEALKVNFGGVGNGGGRGREDGKREMGRGGAGQGKERNTVMLGDVAQVVPKGRVVVVMVAEKEHLKPISTALQSAPLDLAPTSPPSSSPSSQQLEIHLPVPPTTTESRIAAARQAKTKGDAALSALQRARMTQKKRLRRQYLARKLGPDQFKAAGKEMEKINKEAATVMGKCVEEKQRGLMGG